MVDNSQIIMGEDLQLFNQGKTGAFATSLVLTMSSDSTETSNKDFSRGWKSTKVTGRSFEMTTNNMFAFAVDSDSTSVFDLYDAYANGTVLKFVFAGTQNASTYDVGSTGTIIPSKPAGISETGATNDATNGGWSALIDASHPCFYGSCTISNIKITGDNNAVATYEVTLSGVGALLKETDKTKIADYLDMK